LYHRSPNARLSSARNCGQIDCVVTYKVDRLSRSLLDFAKMMETFEQHGVSFVSITQQFNSATSMGRLVLNVLLSFAQFEREIIAERTRDKMAATRRKGKWSGGTPLLGFDLDPRGGRLLVNDDEAQRVRAIFALYLEHEALLPLAQFAGSIPFPSGIGLFAPPGDNSFVSRGRSSLGIASDRFTAWISARSSLRRLTYSSAMGKAGG
jgi:hypothetical protein